MSKGEVAFLWTPCYYYVEKEYLYECPMRGSTFTNPMLLLLNYRESTTMNFLLFLEEEWEYNPIPEYSLEY